VDSLDGQRRDFEAIHRGRERVVARLHANVAQLEKVRFSLLHLRSADAERLGGEASPLLEAIDELSKEIEETSTAVGEVFGHGTSDLQALPAPSETGPSYSMILKQPAASDDGSSEPERIQGGVSDHRRS
jgi:hypothetical protein